MWELFPPRIRLMGRPQLAASEAQQLSEDFEKFRDGLVHPIEPYIRSTYDLDLTSAYGGLEIKNPFGKASGQLSLARHQVEKDAQGGLGFVVLKTVIAQDQTGAQMMREWAIPETRMLVERIRGRDGQEGWTVTWKGRGWYESFEAYLRLLREALQTAKAARMVIAPSVKYHLPTPAEDFWKEEEYVYTTAALVETWQEAHGDSPMPLEKDFSPTLAGSGRAAQQAKILEWLHRVPGLIHRAAPGKVWVGLKDFNTLFSDEFQVQMLREIEAAPRGEGRADFLVYANRLFDPAKEFEGKVGVAYGGPDLSDRNLAVLERYLSSVAQGPLVGPAVFPAPRAGERAGTVAGPEGGSCATPSDRRMPAQPLPLSATGDIHSGRIAAEYLLRGASSFQMHTVFQLPDGEFAMRTGGKTEKVLHRLLFHPQEGFVAWLIDLRRCFGWGSGMNVEQMAAWCREHWRQIMDSLNP